MQCFKSDLHHTNLDLHHRDWDTKGREAPEESRRASKACGGNGNLSCALEVILGACSQTFPARPLLSATLRMSALRSERTHRAAQPHHGAEHPPLSKDRKAVRTAHRGENEPERLDILHRRVDAALSCVQCK